MNSCVLMAEVIQDPELRFTPDNQTPIAEMWVQFAGLREEEPPAKLKVVGWGNLAQEIQERYHQGDRVIIEGRLHMNTIDRPEGFKEKRAELTAQKIHLLDGTGLTTSTARPEAARTDAVQPGAARTDAVPTANETPKPQSTAPRSTPKPAAAKAPAYSAPASAPAGDAIDYDEIPF